MNKVVDGKFFEIDSRRKADIITDIKNLAASYVPEWTFNTDDPDAGSVIASIYSNMLEDDINKLNMLMYKYRVELMNMVGVTLKPVRPAKSVVKFSLLPAVTEGTYVPQKTKLIANGNNGHKVIFETKNSVYVTNSVISDIYSTSRDYGKIIDVLGKKINSDENENKSFFMFDFSLDGIQENKIVIGHNYALNLNTNAVLEVYLKTEKNIEELLTKLADTNEYEWKYLTPEGFVLFDEVKVEDNKILLKKSENSQLTQYDGVNQYYILLGKKNNIASDELSINYLAISSSCKNVLPEIVYQGDYQVDIKEFYPFGDKLAVYNECYIASDNVLSKKEANIELKFNLSYLKNTIELDYSNNNNYKIIMKKPTNVNYSISECRADNVIFEYFNGIGWAKLEIDDKNYMNLFSGEVTGEVSLKFKCPEDINKISVSAYVRYWIRMRLLKADNCYRVPCCHLIPVINDVTFSYNYSGEGVQPEKILRYSGVYKEDIGNKLLKNESTFIFKPIEYSKNNIFIGFNKKFCGGPISLYFDIDGVLKKNTDFIKFEYSCIGDNANFKPLKVVDKTENFRHSGIIMFIPPSDMAKCSIFNKERYWIKIVDDGNEYESLRFLKVNNILVNTVDVENIETKEPEVFYVDKATANMTILLSSSNILYVDVFVNEVTILSIQQMDKILKEDPENVIAEYDNLGNYLSFFVKWKEVNTFIKSKPDDRHYMLDRNKGVITFGDSTNGMIPSKQLTPAIKVFAITCDGANGNVGVGQINKTDVMISFISNIFNPVPAYTGYDVEDVHSALNRGANLLSSYNRLVSEDDFEKAVLDFSNVIDKVKCVSSVNEYGRTDENAITIAILMKEFKKSNEVFSTVKNQIKDYLMDKCEISLKKENLKIIDPIFVKLCVNIWVEVNDYNIAFEIKNDILSYLKDFIDPVNGNFNNRGWEIGTLPREVQLYSFLKSKSVNAVIQKIILTGKLHTINGVDEKEIEDIIGNPFVIGVNGEHEVFVDFK